MIWRVPQTIFTPPSGNCLSACVASLLRRPLWTVPNFAVAGYDSRPIPQWWDRLGRFGTREGLWFVQLAGKHPGECWGVTIQDRPVLAIATIESPNGDWLHCVVGDMRRGIVVHDPNRRNPQDGKPLERIEDWIVPVGAPQ